MYPILLWFPLCLMIVYTNAKIGDKLGNKCESGQYRSDFLSGGCAKCPKILKDCEDQEIDDAVRCFNACRRIYSTVQPKKPTTATFQVRKSSASLPRATLKKTTPNITFVIEVHENFSERRYHPTSRYLSNKPAGNSNMADIIIGITFTMIALVLVLGVCFALYCKRRRNTTNDQLSRSNPSDYTAVAVESRSNSNEDIENSGQTNEQRDIAEVESSINISSVSFEGLNNMTETIL